MLPYKLGTAKITTNHWSLVQIHDLNPVISEFYSLKIMGNNLITILKNSSLYNQEYENPVLLLSTLETRIEKSIRQINPNLLKHREKRGLLNPLGSLIKSITGNLDQTDAEMYEKQIRELQENQLKLKKVSINQITLLEKSINKFQALISNFSTNQLILKSRIEQIERAINKVELQELATFEYFNTHVILNQITMMFQIIFDILEKTEVAITFAKLNTLHNSIINPIEFINEIQTFKTQLNTEILPIESTIENILNFEKIIEIKSYSQGLKITFILEIPLVESDIYHYYKLYPIPVPSNQTSRFFVNLPQKPFLVLSSNKYAYMDQVCLHLKKNQYLCKEDHPVYTNLKPPCAVQLISHMTNITSCRPFLISLSDIQVATIINGKWIVTTPNRIIASVNCPNSKNNIPIFGSYLIEIQKKECTVHIGPFTLKLTKVSEITYDEVILPNINLSQSYRQERKPMFHPKTIDLNNINLKETDEIAAALQEQKRILSELSIPVQVKRINFWTILLYVILVIICIFFISKLVYKKVLIKKFDIENKRQTDEIII